MSSLAASRADNYYFPPDGSVVKSKGSNPYQLHGIIRFELPFDSWCLKCNRHICRGNRFNAKKEKAGKYFSTQIWSFRMKCPGQGCPQQFIIETDPENRSYKFVSGIRRKVEDFTPEWNDSLISATDESTRQLLDTDPMFRLQHHQQGLSQQQSDSQRLESLESYRAAIHRHDADANALLRQKNRARKKVDAERMESGRKRGLGIPLLEVNDEDTRLAKLARCEVLRSRTEADRDHRAVALEQQKFSAIGAQSIFGGVRPFASSTRSRGTSSAGGSMSSSSKRSRTNAESGGGNGSGVRIHTNVPRGRGAGRTTAIAAVCGVRGAQAGEAS